MSAVVVSLSRNGSPPENASPLVYLLIRGLLTARTTDIFHPQVGDMVVEVTHLMGLAQHKLGLLSAVGELLKIEEIEGEGQRFTIRTVEGNETRWLNAEFYVVERPFIFPTPTPKEMTAP
jgi:hypothetical protein